MNAFKYTAAALLLLQLAACSTNTPLASMLGGGGGAASYQDSKPETMLRVGRAWSFDIKEFSPNVADGTWTEKSAAALKIEIIGETDASSYTNSRTMRFTSVMDGAETVVTKDANITFYDDENSPIWASLRALKLDLSKNLTEEATEPVTVSAGSFRAVRRTIPATFEGERGMFDTWSVEGVGLVKAVVETPARRLSYELTSYK